MTTSPHQPALILWDIDHTLLTIEEVSREIYELAFEEVIGQPLRELAEMTGRTERVILTETLALHGVSDPESKFDDCYAALARAADKLRERMRTTGRRLSGAAEAIAALAEHNVVQSVVTGNLKPIAVTKLEVFELAELLDLDVGGYGADGDTRPPLIRQAWQRAQRKYSRTFHPELVVVIGDTPLDVAAAHEVGVRAVGVATGSSTVDELTTPNADAVLPDLTDTSAIVQAVYGATLEH
ncbi:MAG: haloacid dehalogenase-like hydrolase [Actinobacteria bacterium]|nr:haloacid dehalogenase-like hydrolase [Acidobacteriota bacterium]MCA1706162.1 haloacid dehalogenase-like hydrolase [Actinomycetota bacterium]